jgi:hypothetical protein
VCCTDNSGSVHEQCVFHEVLERPNVFFVSDCEVLILTDFEGGAELGRRLILMLRLRNC